MSYYTRVDFAFSNEPPAADVVMNFERCDWVRVGRDGFGKHMILEPRKRKALSFKDQFSFNWFPKNSEQIKLYIYLDIAGRKKPLPLFVFDPNRP